MRYYTLQHYAYRQSSKNRANDTPVTGLYSEEKIMAAHQI